jgi:hypothetical protein
MGKLLDMADKYDSIQDDDEDTLIMVRPEKTYPGVGLLMVLTFSILFWGAVCGVVFR